MLERARARVTLRTGLWCFRPIPLVVLLLPVLRFATCALGCGPSEGEIGVPCHPAQGCHAHDYCDEGVCASGRCTTYTPPPPPPPTCHARPSSVCAADETGFWCPAESATIASVCGEPRDNDGGPIYCCPPCAEIGACGDAGALFACRASYAPTRRRPELACVTSARPVTGDVQYCCAAAATCFVVHDPQCRGAATAYGCTGAAAPPVTVTCTPLPADTERRYCCAAAGDDAGTADVGASPDGS